MKVLLLGGTGEARALASHLVATGIDVTSSLAGRVARPRLPVGEVRIGGFGGVDGLRRALAEYHAVVDATHPFARGISTNAALACDAENVPLIRLARPGWEPQESWRYVDSHADAAVVAARLGSRPFLTIGRQELAQFIPDLGEHHVLARVVDVPDVTIPSSWKLITSRGPYTLDGERALMRSHASDVLITKDSGGSFTWPKLAAAAELGVPVVVVARPPSPSGVATVSTVDEALVWVLTQ